MGVKYFFFAAVIAALLSDYLDSCLAGNGRLRNLLPVVFKIL